jgi:hypothetical protein
VVPNAAGQGPNPLERGSALRKRTARILAAPLALAGVIALAPAANAEPSPPGCPKEYFCAWGGPDRTGQIVVRTRGNWDGGAYFQSYFNNGVRFPGADHVDVYSSHEGSDDPPFCVHYNPGPGRYSGNIGAGAFIMHVRWRGEC